jgi:hypothetical protein
LKGKRLDVSIDARVTVAVRFRVTDHKSGVVNGVAVPGWVEE